MIHKFLYFDPCIKCVLRPLCFFNGLYRTVKYSPDPLDIWVSGHDYVEQENSTLKCERCDFISR